MDYITEHTHSSYDIPVPDAKCAKDLVELIKQLIKEKRYEGVASLFTTEAEAARNINYLKIVGMELYHEVCLPNLTSEMHEDQLEQYNCAEELFCLIASHAPMEELLLEMLEIIEEQKSEYVFTSALRALQVVLLRMSDKKPRALEWSLNSIYTRIEGLTLPEYLKEGYDHKQEQLLEQDEQIEKLLMYYITIELFYKPLVKDVLIQKQNFEPIFFDTTINRRNVLCCFLIQMLGKPLGLLDLTVNKHKTNTYTIQCARSLTESATKCLIDPLRLLCLGEQRIRWNRRLDAQKNVHAMSSNNIFSIEEKLSIESLAIYFYMIFVEEISLDAVPKVYAPIYIFEASLYYVNELLAHEEQPLHYRALLLAKHLLDNLQQKAIPANSLELMVHKNFCYSICSIVGYSSQTHHRQFGVKLLRQYILSFDDEGKYLILKNLLSTITHNGIVGYLAVMYKDLVANALVGSVTATLPSSFIGQDFRTIFLGHICHLPQGVKTDLIEHSDKVISSLNAVRFFAIKDIKNRTGIWNFMNEIDETFLEPLHKALDYSTSHYKAEMNRVKQGLDVGEEVTERKELEILDINITNAKSESDKLEMDMSRTRKIEILSLSLCTFDLIQSLLGRTVECVENSKKIFKTNAF